MHRYRTYIFLLTFSLILASLSGCCDKEPQLFVRFENTGYGCSYSDDNPWFPDDFIPGLWYECSTSNVGPFNYVYNNCQREKTGTYRLTEWSFNNEVDISNCEALYLTITPDDDGTIDFKTDIVRNP